MSREKITLPVVEVRRYPKKWYYVVEYDGRPYQVQLMPFQRESDSRPDRLQCILERSASTGGIYIKQDFAPLLAGRYKPGQLYDFTIEDDYTNTSTPHYKVADGSGFWFKLYTAKGDGYRRGDRVRCRVTRLSGINVSLEAVARIEETANEALPMESLRESVGREVVDTLMSFLDGDQDVEAAADEMRAGDYRWIFHFIEAAWNAVIERGRGDTVLMRRVVAALNRIVLYLLEDTQYLNTLDAAARAEAQTQLSLIAARSEDLTSAIEIVEQGKEQEYITDVLNKMAASGYLYRPERKLRMLMYVFALRKESMDSNMQKFLETIHRGRHENWCAEPFRSAFVNQLELYIDSNHAAVDELSTLDTPVDRDRLEKMLQALAIQQLLYNDEDTAVNHVVNRSRLYRYFTFINRFEQDRLLDKALATVTSRSVIADEFKWPDTSRVDTMATRLLAPMSRDGSSMFFETPAGSLSVGPSGITLSPDLVKADHPVFPSDLCLWQNLNVNLDDQLPADLRQPVTVRDYKRVWAEIERAFFEPVSSADARGNEAKRTPDAGDEVTVIVDGIDQDNPLRMHCTVVDPVFSGHGWIVMKEVTNMDRPAPLSSFRNAQGKPYLLKAEVRAVEDGVLQLSMRPAIGRMLYDLVAPDDEVDCVITYCDERQHRYIAFSENGYSLFIDPGDFRGQMRRSLNMRARVTFVRPDGLAVNGRCIATDGMPISYADSVQVLMASFSEEKVCDRLPDSAPEPGSQGDVARSDDEMLTTGEMTEIMRIIGRKGDVEEDLVKRFNYHSFAGFVARMLGLESQAEYYRQRCAVIGILDDFATNGQVDPELLDEVSREHTGILTSTSDGRKLLTLSMLDRPDSNQRLWTVCNEADSDVLGRLARLVLAYNLLDGYKMGEERGHIRSEIYSLLNLRRDVQPMQIEQGLESQKVEFKTSAIYLPGPRMRRDVRAQTAEIVEKITGMLNADGGRIYIGVSDEGYIRGLAPDMEFFGSRDKFELNLRNSVTEHCGFIPNGNSHIVTSWQTFGDKEVYVIDLTPTDEPVAFDGIYYQRQGTSNRFVPAGQVEAFIAARRGDGGKVAESPAPAAPVAPVVEDADCVIDTLPATVSDDCEGGAATTALRPNVLHDGYEGYSPVSAWLYFGNDDSLIVSDTDLWLEDESALTLALTEEELDGDLLMVYRSGGVAVSPMRFAIKNFEKEPRRLRKNDPLVFAAPVSRGQGLLLYSRDSGGNVFRQAFRPESLPHVGMLKGQGERLMKDMTPVWAELIEPDRMAMFAGIMRNGQKVKGDYKADIKTYAEPRLGI